MTQDTSYPLSPRQRRLVELSRDGAPPAAVWAVVRLAAGESAGVDEAALARAVALTARRHEILRTRLAEAPGLTLPVQRVAEAGGPELEIADAGGGVADDGALVRRAAEEAERRAAEGSGAAAILLRNGGDGALLLTAPATADDPAGLLRWAEEIVVAYGDPDALEPVELQFSQIAEWQSGLLADPDEEEARAYWREHDPGALADLPVPLAGPEAERPPRAEIGGRRASVRRPLSVGSFAAAAEAGSEALLLTAWRVTVARLTGDPAGRTGIWAAGRQLDVLAGSLGPIGRHLPIGPVGESAFVAGQSFADAMAATAEALEHATEAQEQLVPGELPAAGDGATRSDRPDRFAVAFRHLALGAPRLAAGVRFVPVACGGALEPVGVELIVEESEAGLTATLAHDPRLLDTAAAGRLLDAYETLLGAALADPRTRLADLPLLSPEAARRELAAGIAPPAVPTAGAEGTEPDAPTFPARFARRAAERPEDPALIEYGGEVTVSFGALEARSRRLAGRLIALGAGPEVPVALVGNRDAATLVALVAILRAGATLLPLDPTHPEGRIAAFLEAARPVAVLTSRGGGSGPPEPADDPLRHAADAAGVPWLGIGSEEAEEEAAGDGADARLPEVDPETAAYLLFTSGSTGVPKGTRVSHRSLAHLDDALAAGVYGPLEESLGAPVRRLAMNAPLVFDASVKQWLQLARGRALVTVRDSVRLDARRFVAELAGRTGQGADLVDATPSHLAVLLDAGLAGSDGPRAVLVGGEAIDPALWRRLHADAGRRYVDVYGPTECTVDVTAGPVTDEGPPRLGPPLPGVRVHLLDGAGRPVVRGAPGEIFVGGPGVARGYHASAGATAERFVPDPFSESPGERLFATGDLARRRADGSLGFLGRRDRQVKLRGLRLELGEIEAVLAAHPEVSAAAVDLGGEHLHAWAAVGAAAARGAERLREALRDHLRHRLPEYMVPAFVGVLADLPRTDRGKVDRTALAALAARGAAAPRRGPRLAPRNQTEERLAEIWSRVLGVDEVGVEDNFFDLGGHSLLMVRLYDELQRSFDTDLPMLELFRHPTVAALAGALESERTGGGARGTRAETVDAGRIRDRARRQAAAAAATAHRRRAPVDTEKTR